MLDITKVLSSNNDVNENKLIKKEVIVFHGGEYLAQEHTTYTNSKCLGYGNYEFIIYDLHGDGMCCDYGQGNHKLSVRDIKQLNLDHLVLKKEHHLKFYQ